MSKALVKSMEILSSRLRQRKENGLFRKLDLLQGLTDFCSNDYLGFSRNEALSRQIEAARAQYKPQGQGATGSRLISGNSIFAEELEHYLADAQGTETALLFNSGYAANLGLFSAIAQKGDTIITDELIHASVIDGCRTGFATRLKFKHNDLQSLEEKLKAARGICYVAVESLYSMDGDIAPLKEINVLCKKYGALLLVDEAHAFGVFGKGLVYELGLSKEVFATLLTFGKALGGHGAVLLGPELLYHYLINFARSFIYSTALPFEQLLHIRCSYIYLHQNRQLQTSLNQKTEFFKNQFVGTAFEYRLKSGPIQPVLIPGNEAVKKASRELRKMGLAVWPILSPTVAPGAERLRICLHSYNSAEEIEMLAHYLLQNPLPI
jgi:8-amino-7-oxononanoate synthase